MKTRKTTKQDRRVKSAIHERCSRPSSKSSWQGDVNAVLTDYAPGAILFTKGADAIRPLFEAVIAEFENPEQHPK